MSAAPLRRQGRFFARGVVFPLGRQSTAPDRPNYASESDFDSGGRRYLTLDAGKLVAHLIQSCELSIGLFQLDALSRGRRPALVPLLKEPSSAAPSSWEVEH